VDFGSIQVDTSRDGVLVVGLDGEHDIANAREVEDAIKEHSGGRSAIVSTRFPRSSRTLVM
jgi:hypothetical protein